MASDSLPPYGLLACHASLSFTVSQSLLKFMSIELMMLSNHLILCCPSPFAFNLSQHQGLFQCESSGRSTGASMSASVLPVNIQGWFPLGLTGLISLQSKGLSRVFSSTTVRKHQFFGMYVCNQQTCQCLTHNSLSLPSRISGWLAAASICISAWEHCKPEVVPGDQCCWEHQANSN